MFFKALDNLLLEQLGHTSLPLEMEGLFLIFLKDSYLVIIVTLTLRSLNLFFDQYACLVDFLERLYGLDFDVIPILGMQVGHQSKLVLFNWLIRHLCILFPPLVEECDEVFIGGLLS